MRRLSAVTPGTSSTISMVRSVSKHVEQRQALARDHAPVRAAAWRGLEEPPHFVAEVADVGRDETVEIGGMSSTQIVSLAVDVENRTEQDRRAARAILPGRPFERGMADAADARARRSCPSGRAPRSSARRGRRRSAAAWRSRPARRRRARSPPACRCGQRRRIARGQRHRDLGSRLARDLRRRSRADRRQRLQHRLGQIAQLDAERDLARESRSANSASPRCGRPCRPGGPAAP